mmetsp:Transcript_57324/g.166387  ORF Transcript_57324/g.166387 Transcript_57324/m.166387 type:complete len:290 (+) Transcript_57324:3172-4041(+)
MRCLQRAVCDARALCRRDVGVEGQGGVRHKGQRGQGGGGGPFVGKDPGALRRGRQSKGLRGFDDGGGGRRQGRGRALRVVATGGGCHGRREATGDRCGDVEDDGGLPPGAGPAVARGEETRRRHLYAKVCRGDVQEATCPGGGPQGRRCSGSKRRCVVRRRLVLCGVSASPAVFPAQAEVELCSRGVDQAAETRRSSSRCRSSRGCDARPSTRGGGRRARGADAAARRPSARGTDRCGNGTEAAVDATARPAHEQGPLGVRWHRRGGKTTSAHHGAGRMGRGRRGGQHS